MQRTLLIWGAVLIAGLAIVSVMGYLYPYVSKWDKQKVRIPSWTDKRRPRILIRERFNFGLASPIIASLFSVIAFIIAVLSEPMRELMSGKPWFLDIIIILLLAMMHFLAWFVMTAVSYIIAITKVTYLDKKYREELRADVTNRTVFDVRNIKK
jgi:cytochrome c biogenesis factor